MEMGDILACLEFNTGKFPRGALEEASKRRTEITPFLLEGLERDVARSEFIERESSYMAHLYAMYLLAEFREVRAYPLVVRFCRLPGELPLALSGDVVTEDMDRILASVCGGDTGSIEDLVEDPDLNEYVRCAAMRSMLALAVDGQRSREQVVTYFKSLFEGRLEREPSLAWCGLVSCCDDLYPGEFVGEIAKAYEEELVDPWFISQEDVDRRLSGGKDAVLADLRSRYAGLIRSAVEEMEGWACFEEDRRWHSQKKRRDAIEDSFRYVTPTPKAGPSRNAPCPCGSGKKYKRCCGRTGV
jgi:hypothetical protein